MKKIFPLILIFISICFSSVAQKKSTNNASKNEGSADNNPMVIVDSSVTTKTPSPSKARRFLTPQKQERCLFGTRKESQLPLYFILIMKERM